MEDHGDDHEPRGGWSCHEHCRPPTGHAADPLQSSIFRPDMFRGIEDHEDKLCVPRQIAALICEDFGIICLEFDRIEEELYQTSNWTENGVTSRMIVEFARQRDLPVCILHGEKLMEVYPGTGKPLCFTIHENHAYFYRGMHARR